MTRCPPLNARRTHKPWQERRSHWEREERDEGKLTLRDSLKLSMTRFLGTSRLDLPDLVDTGS